MSTESVAAPESYNVKKKGTRPGWGVVGVVCKGGGGGVRGGGGWGGEGGGCCATKELTSKQRNASPDTGTIKALWPRESTEAQRCCKWGCEYRHPKESPVPTPLGSGEKRKGPVLATPRRKSCPEKEGRDCKNEPTWKGQDENPRQRERVRRPQKGKNLSLTGPHRQKKTPRRV